MGKQILPLQKGFTLIEVLITIAILATLTVLTTQAISQAIQAKGKLQSQLDDVSRLRDALRLIEGDINLAYHYRDIDKEIKKLLKKQANPSQQQQIDPNTGLPMNSSNPDPQQDPTTAATPVEAPPKDPTTRFVGSGESMHFVTMNNARLIRNTKQADFMEVGYSVRECRSLKAEGGSSKCLWRRSSPYADLDVTKGGDEVVLLENVSEFKLRYIGKGKQDWGSDWRSDSQGDGITKGNFPLAVEVSITTEREEKGRKKKYSMQLVVPIHFPNNPEEGSSGQSKTSTF